MGTMKSKAIGKILTVHEAEALLRVLKIRFENHPERHEGITWADVAFRLCGIKGNYEKIFPLREMENTGGEPDVVSYDLASDGFTFFDCSPETPKQRVSLC